MKTMTFKISDDDAKRVRSAARRAGLSLSEYVRHRLLRGNPGRLPIVRRTKCRHTGAMIFVGSPQLPPLTTESVREMLADFP